MSEPHNRLTAYGVAVLATAVTVLARFLLWPVLGDAVPHMFFFPAIMVAAYYGGYGPGFLSTILCALAANFFFTEPRYSLQIKSLNAAVAMPLFVLVGAIISGLCEVLHRARRRIVADERRRAEETLRETQERFEQLAENIHEIFWIRDAQDDRLTYVSPGVEGLWGVTPQDLYANPCHWFDKIHPDDRQAVIESWQRRKRGEFTTLESRLVRPDGSIRWVRSRGFPISEENGTITRVGGLTEDITERKKFEDDLRDSEGRWRNLTEALPQLVWSARCDGECDYFSTQWSQHTGIPESELLGWRWLETLHPDDREPTRRIWLDSVAGRSPYDVEYRIRRHDGVYRWFKTRGSPIRNDAGHICKWFGTCTDMTDVKSAEEELRVAKEAAESANRAKDEFLANVSHEIRTPMNAILGMTELTLDSSLTDDQRQSLVTVKSAADNLLGIINDLLDFSKIEAGKLELDPASFSLRRALGDTVRALAVRAHGKGLEVICHVQPNVPDALVGDAGRLRQILINLIGNAIKFTERGEIVVHCGFDESKSTEKLNVPSNVSSQSTDIGLRFTVSDTGIGIPRDKQASIFRAFEQEDTSTTRRFGGTGLGLTIAARLVALMGGRVSVESEPGNGSIFAFTARFELQADQLDKVSLPPPVSLHGLRVLIVDDNSTNRRILTEWIRGWQMEPSVAGDGMAAMDALWHAATDGKPFALVILDARMRDTDGLALAAKIRERATFSSSRLILLTSGERPGEAAQARDLQINAHLLKPVQQDELLGTICQIMSQRYAGSDQDSAIREKRARPPSIQGPRILVAEDNEFNSQLLEQLLVRRGYRVSTAKNGRQALSLATRCAFDLLLLDIHMPELDGFQVVEAIREREREVGGHLPIIALTARSRKEDRERCLAAGMDDFLSKPIQTTDLWAAIDRVSRYGKFDNASRPTPNSDSLARTRRCTKLIDPQVLLAACGDDAVTLEKICRAFRLQMPNHLSSIQTALRDRDAPRLREAAHKLAGMVAVFSTSAGDLASSLEEHADQERLDECRPLEEELAAMSSELIRQVGNLSIDSLHGGDRQTRMIGVDDVEPP